MSNFRITFKQWKRAPYESRIIEATDAAEARNKLIGSSPVWTIRSISVQCAALCADGSPCQRFCSDYFCRDHVPAIPAPGGESFEAVHLTEEEARALADQIRDPDEGVHAEAVDSEDRPGYWNLRIKRNPEPQATPTEEAHEEKRRASFRVTIGPERFGVADDEVELSVSRHGLQGGFSVSMKREQLEVIRDALDIFIARGSGETVELGPKSVELFHGVRRGGK